MTDTLVVLMHDDVAGTVIRPSGDRIRFEYADSYRTSPKATPLSRAMPLTVRSHPDAVISPWLWGLLPDNDDVLARWARQFQVSRTPFSLLGTRIGEDCAGAVRFCPDSEVDRLISRAGQVEWLDEAGVAARIRDLRTDPTAWLGTGFTGQFSLAGAQAKTALHWDGSRWGVPIGSKATTHILKPAVRGFDDHELNEHICLEAARRVGMAAARTRVERFADESVVVVERYDRLVTRHDLGHELTISRVHQEDLCQSLAVPPWRKYQNEGGPGALDIIALLRREIPPRAAVAAAQSFVDALIWNWVIAGTDAHAKNYSLLLSGGDVRLAPLYDIASALPYGAHERKLRMAMKIGGEYDLWAVRDRWAKAAAEWDLDPEQLRARVLEVIRAAPEAFSNSAADAAVTALGRKGPARLVDAVAARASRLADTLSRRE